MNKTITFFTDNKALLTSLENTVIKSKTNAEAILILNELALMMVLMCAGFRRTNQIII